MVRNIESTKIPTLHNSSLLILDAIITTVYYFEFVRAKDQKFKI